MPLEDLPRELRTLDFGRCRLALAVPEETPFTGTESLVGKRIATTYAYLLGAYLRKLDVRAEIVTLSGAVEIAPRLYRRLLAMPEQFRVVRSHQTAPSC